MHALTAAPVLAIDPETGTPIFPSSEVWAGLDAGARAAVLEVVRQALAATSDAAPGESTRHSTPARETINSLEHHFRRLRRGLFIAQGLAVCYPNEATFSPDVMAVLDVALGERDAWLVESEGRGLDFALEILVHGDRKKDLVTNVERYARLGIPEYFVFDVARAQLLGYRLPAQGTLRYHPIVPQYGRIPCETLGLELAVVAGRLRFFRGGAEVQGPVEEVEFLARMVEERERALRDEIERANAAEIRAEAEATRAAAEATRAEAEATRAEAETSRAEAEATRAEAEATRAEAEATRAEAAVVALRQTLSALLRARGLSPSPEQSRRLAACTEVATLARLAGAAAVAGTADEVFDALPPAVDPC